MNAISSTRKARRRDRVVVFYLLCRNGGGGSSGGVRASRCAVRKSEVGTEAHPTFVARTVILRTAARGIPHRRDSVATAAFGGVVGGVRAFGFERRSRLRRTRLRLLQAFSSRVKKSARADDQVQRLELDGDGLGAEGVPRMTARKRATCPPDTSRGRRLRVPVADTTHEARRPGSRTFPSEAPRPAGPRPDRAELPRARGAARTRTRGAAPTRTRGRASSSPRAKTRRPRVGPRLLPPSGRSLVTPSETEGRHLGGCVPPTGVTRPSAARARVGLPRPRARSTRASGADGRRAARARRATRAKGSGDARCRKAFLKSRESRSCE